MDSEDEVGHALGDLQHKLQKELDRSIKEVKSERRARETAEEEVQSMRDAIVQAQEEERRRAEQAIQAIVSGE